MSDSLRVKNIGKKEDVAVKVKNGDKDGGRSKKKNATLAFREMWADAFLRKRVGIEVSENITIKQKQPSPYIYLRVLFMFITMFVLVFSVFYLFHGYEMYPILIALMSITVPAVGVIFFFEMDTSGRLSISNVVLLLFIACAIMLAVKFVSARFIYEMGGEAISYYGAMAIGLMECFSIFALVSGFVAKLKIKDAMTGILIGVIIGGGFALINNVYFCFKESFVQNAYSPLNESVLYNETLFSSMTNNVKFVVPEYILHSVLYMFMGAILGGNLVNVFNKGIKDKIATPVLVLLTLLCWAFSSLWVVPFTTVLFVYVLDIVMIISSCIAVIKTVKNGLSNNNYV